jgi:hypothetical protein
MSSILGNRLNPNITLSEFIKLLKDNNIDFTDYHDTYDGHMYISPWTSYFDGRVVSDLRFIFSGEDKDSKLLDVRFEARNELGLHVKYTSDRLHRPWYKRIF